MLSIELCYYWAQSALITTTVKIAKCNLGTQCTFSRTQAKGSRYIPYYWRLGLETGDVAVGEGEGKVVVVMQYTGGELHWPELTTKLPGSFQGGRRGAGRGAGRGREGAGRGQRYVGCMGVQGRVQGGGSGCRVVRGAGRCREVQEGAGRCREVVRGAGR